MGENAEIEYSITEGEGLDMFDVITDQETQEGIITVKKVMHFLNTIQIKAFTLLWSSSNWGQLHKKRVSVGRLGATDSQYYVKVEKRKN